MRVDAQVKLGRNNAAMNNMYRLLIAVAVFVLIYLALALANLSIGGLGLFLFAIFRMAPRVSQLNNIAYNIDSKIPHIKRIGEFIDDLETNKEIDEGSEPVPDPVETVAFDSVSFRYNEEEQVLDRVSFEVDRGEFVAFVGSSGAGKSTIVSLLGRLYEPDQGKITANDIPLREFPISEWRETVAVVRQNPYLFSDTLRYNLTVGNPDASQAEVEKACEIARVDEFLDTLPNGYETNIGDEGVRLSGGQRQRVALARALLKDTDVLVLDEATSDLDNTIEQEVHKGIISMERDCILVVVAHRLSTVRGADRIYAMKGGRIAEAGAHQELIEQDGMYAHLYQRP
jgi:subfamily B ATP-binding cassette protein MsbA